MSDSRSAVYDDEMRYKSLCEKFGEEPKPKGVYGEHRQALEKRVREEHEKEETEAVRRSTVGRAYKRMLSNLLIRLEEHNHHDLIAADPELIEWWAENRAEYDERRKRKAAEEEKARLVKQARSKLTPEECEALEGLK